MATASVVEHSSREEEPGSGQEWNSLAAALEEASPASTPRVRAPTCTRSRTAPSRSSWSARCAPGQPSAPPVLIKEIPLRGKPAPNQDTEKEPAAATS
ncbi:hypothetical protein ACTXG6_03140 [Pseudonocardia sp. Cha107L01]|uniref:hypothetical protein n=1 Tax=Pseudonocardia sp. Cha107L01 TaxID=3457576 RepID=UPI00403E51CF